MFEFIYTLLYILKFVLNWTFLPFASFFLHAQDCKHQGDIGVANRPRKEAADVARKECFMIGSLDAFGGHPKASRRFFLLQKPSWDLLN